MASKKINKNQKLQAQVKMALKRRNSSSSEEDIQLVKLKKKLLQTEEKLKNYERQETEVFHEPSPEAGGSQIERVDGGDDDQVYGSNYDENMVCIGNDVYCRKIIHDMALGSSHKSSHIARKLLEGVFKITVLLKSTLTGQSPRAQGLQRQLEPVVPLCYRARAAIIDFSLKVAKERGWEVQTVKDIERAMSQRLGELKRQKRP